MCSSFKRPRIVWTQWSLIRNFVARLLFLQPAARKGRTMQASAFAAKFPASAFFSPLKDPRLTYTAAAHPDNPVQIISLTQTDPNCPTKNTGNMLHGARISIANWFSRDEWKCHTLNMMMNAVTSDSVIFKVHHQTQTDACFALVFLMKMLAWNTISFELRNPDGQAWSQAIKKACRIKAVV